MAALERDRTGFAPRSTGKLLRGQEAWLYYRLAADLHKTVAEIKRLPSEEITGWQAYYQVVDWMKKAEAETTEQAFTFARSVHEIFEERAKAKQPGGEV